MTTAKRSRRPARLDTSNLTDLRVGLYCRVSLDKDDTGKSTTDQVAIGREWAQRVGAVIAGEYVEPGSRSASAYAKKARDEFNRLLADIEAGKLDVLWFWEQSRTSRRLDVFAQLRDLCRDMGVLWVERDRVIDPNNDGDTLMAGIKAVMDEGESKKISLRTTRGKKSSAYAGRRGSKVPYGYRPVYSRDGKYLYDEPDTFDGNGAPVEDSPAYVVREIYSRLLAGDSIISIRRDLNDRGIRTRPTKKAPLGDVWNSTHIRYIALNPTYLGQRTYRIDAHQPTDLVRAVLADVETNWPALVDAETFWAVHRLLTDPARGIHRPGRTEHLLSALVRCAECGAKLRFMSRWKQRARGRVRECLYSCDNNFCLAIYQDALDEFVERVMKRWLSDPDVVADLTGGDDSAAAALARGDLERLRVDLATLHRDAKAGRVTPTIASSAEQGLHARIAEAQDRLQAATLPPVLRGNIGPQAAAGWDALDLPVKKQIIRAVADIRVHRAGRHGPIAVPAADRVTWTWLLGPDQTRSAG